MCGRKKNKDKQEQNPGGEELESVGVDGSAHVVATSPGRLGSRWARHLGLYEDTTFFEFPTRRRANKKTKGKRKQRSEQREEGKRGDSGLKRSSAVQASQPVGRADSSQRGAVGPHPPVPPDLLGRKYRGGGAQQRTHTGRAAPAGLGLCGETPTPKPGKDKPAWQQRE